MPTPLSVGFDLTFQAANDTSNKRPLAIVAGWLGAKPRQLRPYLEWYHAHDIDTLSFACGPQHILFPENAEKQMRKVLEFCKSTERAAVRDKLIFHSFSVGGFLFGQMLRQLDTHADLAPAPGVIKAQVFDSPPDFSGIAKGVSRSMGVGAPWNKAIEVALSSYLAVTANTSVGRGHRAASAAFHGNTVPAPALWFYSKSDPVANWEDCEIVINKWKGRGIQVDQCVWADSPHIQHGRVDPDRYFNTLKGFLKANQVI
jgi:hypothetical protein